MKNITIAGNIGKDAETRTTQSGDSVTRFNVAVEDRRGKEKTTIWFTCSIWGKRGEALSPYLTKGGKVAVSGDLSPHEHEGKTYLQISTDQVTLLGGKPDSDRAPSNDRAGKAPAGYGAGGTPMDDGGDIPFAASVL